MAFGFSDRRHIVRGASVADEDTIASRTIAKRVQTTLTKLIWFVARSKGESDD